jgi:putative modified peptide
MRRERHHPDSHPHRLCTGKKTCDVELELLAGLDHDDAATPDPEGTCRHSPILSQRSSILSRTAAAPPRLPVVHTPGEHRVSKNTIAGADLDKILDRMQNDASFREKLLGDPAAALAEHDVDVDPATIPAVRKLPPANAIAEQRDALKSKIDGRVGLAFFLLST